MAESRIELLAWLNELLQTRYTKVEQAGTGKVIIKCTSSINKLSLKVLLTVKYLTQSLV